MSRLDDLIDLLRSTCDMYLINPARNVRSAYIQIDDLAELTLKTWLQENVTGWSAISHQRYGRNYFKGFQNVVDEVKSASSSGSRISAVLDRFVARRGNRNRFFHDHQMSALTVTETECLRAFCDLNTLLAGLFPDFLSKLRSNRTVLVQTTIVRLREAAQTEDRLSTYVRKGLALVNVSLDPGMPAHDLRCIYEDPNGALTSIRGCFDDELDDCRGKIDRIKHFSRQTSKHREILRRLAAQRDWLEAAVQRFF